MPHLPKVRGEFRLQMGDENIEVEGLGLRNRVKIIQGTRNFELYTYRRHQTRPLGVPEGNPLMQPAIEVTIYNIWS